MITDPQFPERGNQIRETRVNLPSHPPPTPSQPILSVLTEGPLTSTALIVQPAVTIADAAIAYQRMVAFVQKVLHRDIDYGIIPGTQKQTLLLPGAEKLATFFALRPRLSEVRVVEDYTGSDHNGEPFFAYTYRCELYGPTGEVLAEAHGTCNSWEEKYRLRWVAKEEVPQGVDLTRLQVKGGKVSELDFAIQGKETNGQYGKPLAYWENWERAITIGRTACTAAGGGVTGWGVAANVAGAAIPGKPRKSKAGKDLATWEMDGTLYGLPNQRVSIRSTPSS